MAAAGGNLPSVPGAGPIGQSSGYGKGAGLHVGFAHVQMAREDSHGRFHDGSISDHANGRFSGSRDIVHTRNEIRVTDLHIASGRFGVGNRVLNPGSDADGDRMVHGGALLLSSGRLPTIVSEAIDGVRVPTEVGYPTIGFSFGSSAPAVYISPCQTSLVGSDRAQRQISNGSRNPVRMDGDDHGNDSLGGLLENCSSLPTGSDKGPGPSLVRNNIDLGQFLGFPSQEPLAPTVGQVQGNPKGDLRPRPGLGTNIAQPVWETSREKGRKSMLDMVQHSVETDDGEPTHDGSRATAHGGRSFASVVTDLPDLGRLPEPIFEGRIARVVIPQDAYERQMEKYKLVVIGWVFTKEQNQRPVQTSPLGHIPINSTVPSPTTTTILMRTHAQTTVAKESMNVVPSNQVGHWADATNDEEDLNVGEDDLMMDEGGQQVANQPGVNAIQSDIVTVQTNSGVAGVNLGRVEVVFNDIFAMDEALQGSGGAVMEVGKRHRG
ncbi:hypothetical protein NE237_005147 [Protea cynaroides]|uniref:Uncharacterized protein n=1 Tax=Protea cynaroides TaxID=273540 RepID=A0A9Q0KJY7_9MAGN|nr:hypothetical protein NE237_005147 [Protea cynaroides]